MIGFREFIFPVSRFDMNLNSLLRYVEAKKPRNVRPQYAVIRCFLTQFSHNPILMCCSAGSLRSCGLLGGSPAKSSLGVLRTANCEDAGRCLWQRPGFVLTMTTILALLAASLLVPIVMGKTALDPLG